MAEKGEREGRKKTKTRTKTKTKNRGGKSFVYVCTRGWASFLVARDRARVCKNETLMGKTFGLPENRDYFSLLPTLAESKVSPFLHY